MELEQNSGGSDNNNSHPKKSSLPIIITVIVLLAVAGVVGWMQKKKPVSLNQSVDMKEQTETSHDDEKNVTNNVPVNGSTTSTAVTGNTITISGDQAKKITVVGSSFKFAPSEIRVKKGDVVTINFQNSGGNHDFVIDEFNVKTKVIAGGESDSVTFTADKVGTFEYYCSVGNHRAMGMKGNLIVE